MVFEWVVVLFTDWLEGWVRRAVVKFVEFLPVKVIRDDNGVPFLYRYHLFSWSADGPGMCIHHFVKSDPDRGFHDHPWRRSLSFILCGGYCERIITRKDGELPSDPTVYTTQQRSRWQFNYLDGERNFHRVMIPDGTDAWTIFFFGPRSKTWGMVGLDGKYKAMSATVKDQDGGWWKYAKTGFGLFHRVPLRGVVAVTVDMIILSSDDCVLLIRRGKDPFRNCWAFPGGRIDSSDSDMLSAAERELFEETSLTDIKLVPVVTIGNSTRDPRGFCVSIVFRSADRVDRSKLKVRAGDDAVDYHWCPIKSVPPLAFDHESVLQTVLKE